MRATTNLSDGNGLQVIHPNPDHGFDLDEELLTGLLDRPDIRDRSVVLLVVAGAFRKGKSFLLDLFLRYLHHRYELNLADGEWLGSEDEPLTGFDWRGGSERHTAGLLIWSQPFKATLDNGEQVAILLMDTQGTFDSESTIRDNATIFALSAMVSSILIYNLSHTINEADLQHLQLFTDYGRVAMKTENKPFQDLMFLIRDWSVPYEYGYGAEGGQKFLNKKLEVHETQHEELKTLRREIKSFFGKLTCFLLPHPGMTVATSDSFQGKLLDVDVEFKQQIKKLVPSLLAPEKLKPKIMSGQKIKVKELLHYIRSYMEVFNGSDLPVPQTIYEATAQANNLSAIADAREVYETLMEEVAGSGRPYLLPERLSEEHRLAEDKALLSFHSKKKMGGNEKSEYYKERLQKDLDEQYERWQSQNESKNRVYTKKAIIVFAVLLVIGSVVSEVGDVIGFGLLEFTGQGICLVALAALGFLMYSRYTGQMVDFNAVLEDVAEKLRNIVVLMDRAMSGAFLGDVTIPFDENLVKAEMEKKRKYMDLAHEATDMWDVDRNYPNSRVCEQAKVVYLILQDNWLVADVLPALDNE